VKRLRNARFDWGIVVASMFVLVAIVVQFHIAQQVWGSDLAGMDDSAHYTTGVMVYEYFRTALFSNPMAFAESFYVRFPKVALGHWPPVYYVLQALWYGVFSPLIGSARMLSAGICGTLAAVLFARVRKAHGLVIGALSSACFLVLPPVQMSAWLVMSDLLVALFMLLAAMAFADFMESNRKRDALWFAVWSILAILTKGSAWALGLFMLLAPLLAKRFSCYRNKWYWVAGAAITMLSAPFYVVAQAHQVGYPADVTQLARGAAEVMGRFSMLVPFGTFLPGFVLLIAFAGCLALFRSGTTAETAAAALILSQVLFLLLFPLTREGRYFMPSAAAITILFARGMALFGRLLGPVTLAAACFAVCGLGKVERIEGYRAAVESIPFRPQGTVMLVASDAPGEGAFVAERLEHDRARAGVVLRGSKVLARSNWWGGDYRLIFRSASELRDYLRSVPVRYLAIDESCAKRPHQLLLEEAVRSRPEEFRVKGRFPISGGRRGDVLLYECLQAGDRPAVINFKLNSRIE
jgi:hypothetical protein